MKSADQRYRDFDGRDGEEVPRKAVYEDGRIDVKKTK
jgi:hypothetical protein